MADYYESHKNPTSSFLNFISKNSTSDTTESSSIMSPTSILDFKPFPNNLWPSQQGLSLGLVEALNEDTPGPNSTRPVLLGSQLKIQVPPLHPFDFGIKSQVGRPFSPSNLRKHVNSGPVTNEMELSEDYTCVISYGPNPRTTHIFDDCIVESCCGVVKFSESRKDDRSMSFYPSDTFLSCCCNCNKNLEQGCDIYMYRGEKAFCSVECRCKEMTTEEEEWF